MSMQTMKRAFTTASLLLCSLAASAHPGHGEEPSHWHASDALGLVLALAVAAWLWHRLRK
jgi:hypothetical protein